MMAEQAATLALKLSQGEVLTQKQRIYSPTLVQRNSVYNLSHLS